MKKAAFLYKNYDITQGCGSGRDMLCLAESEVELVGLDAAHSGLLLTQKRVGGLPHVQNFTEAMYDKTTSKFFCKEKRLYDDLECTGRTDYKVWLRYFEKV